jgi:hypothetical protein
MKSSERKQERGVYVPPGRRTQSLTPPIGEEKSEPEIEKPSDAMKEELPRKERGVYVPPGRRNHISEGKSDIEGVTDSISSMNLNPSSSYNHKSEYVAPDWESLDHEFKDFIPNDRLDSCCLIIKNYPVSASELAKENEIRPYFKFNCEAKWLSPQTCLLCFLNESIASKAITANLSSIHRPILLGDYSYRDSDTYNREFTFFNFIFSFSLNAIFLFYLFSSRTRSLCKDQTGKRF